MTGPHEGAGEGEWTIVARHLDVPGGDAGPEIPRILHRFWTGGPMREGAFRFLLSSARARAHGWALFLWFSSDIEAVRDRPASAPRLTPGAQAERGRQRDALRREGHVLRSVEELLAPGCRWPVPESQARQIRAAARVAAEHPDAGEVGANLKCFSDIARLAYLRELGGLHLDADIGLGDMELDRPLRHQDPRGLVPLLGALGRDRESSPEAAADLHAAREARRAGRLDVDRVRRLADQAVFGARAYNAVIATRPGNPHVDLALRALLDELAPGSRDLPSGIDVMRALLCGASRDPAELEAAAALSVPPYLTRLEQLTAESDRDPPTERENAV